VPAGYAMKRASRATSTDSLSNNLQALT